MPQVGVMVNGENYFEALQACVKNRLDPAVFRGKRKFAGVIGDAPSLYSKSPALWNAVFTALQLDIVYVPLDVEESKLSRLLALLKTSPRFLGANVTVPYKIKIIPHLDQLEEKTQRVTAVNTIVRSARAKLTGYNTDGEGFLASLLETLPGQERPILQSLTGIDVLLIGAGGAARAVAFALAEVLGPGALIICNRTRRAADSLVRDLRDVLARVTAIGERELSAWAPRVGLIVNCSIKGQGGWRRTADQKTTLLEPYSALAPAHPGVVPQTEPPTPELYRKWLKASRADIEANNRASLAVALAVPAHVVFCDLVYAPAETVFLRHGRYSGHPTLNGKSMIIAQAAQALFHRIGRATLERAGLHVPETYQRVLELMFAAW